MFTSITGPVGYYYKEFYSVREIYLERNRRTDYPVDVVGECNASYMRTPTDLPANRNAS